MSIVSSDTVDEAYLAERAGLKLDIAKIIKPHQRSDSNPPYSTAALIVMAVVSSREKHVSRVTILTWIIRSFKFYTNRALDSCLEFAEGGVIDTDKIFEWFNEAFDAYDIPLILVEEAEYEYRYDIDDFKSGTRRYSVDNRAARVYLRHWLEPTRKGAFRFLDLPAEIRNTIYEMTLQYPSSGIRVLAVSAQRLDPGQEPACWVNSLAVMERAHDIVRPFDDWSSVGDEEEIALPPLQQILSILLVCKQVYQETAKTFYQINTFCFEDTGTFAALSHGRAKSFYNFGGLLFEHSNSQDTASWLVAVEALAKQKSCKFLSLAFTDHFWLDMSKDSRMMFGRTNRFTKISQIPGFDRLAFAAFKAGTFELSESSSLIKAFLDQEIAKLKSGVGKLSKPYKKRTATSKTKKTKKTKQTVEAAKTPVAISWG